MVDISIISPTIQVDLVQNVINLEIGNVGIQGPAGTTDHGALTGLDDDDHAQYHNNARGDARYYTQNQVDTALSANSTGDRARANHTGTQAASTISNFNTAADARIANARGAANGVAPLDASQKVPVANLPLNRPSISIPIYNPNDHYAVLPKPALFYVDPDQYPNGISIKEARLSSYAAVTYSMGVIDMSTPNDASPTTITTLSLSASRETSNTLSTTVAAGRYIGLNIPSTTATYVNTQIWFEAL